MKTYLVIVFVLCGVMSFAQHHDHAGHGDKAESKGATAFESDKLSAAYNNYISLKDALVASNASEAKAMASELSKTLKEMDNGKKALEISNKIAASSDLKSQRKDFSSLSNEMTALVKTAKITSGNVFVEYCPMANNNEGASWLSNEKEIKNPYFGDMMLKCGSVKETLSSN